MKKELFIKLINKVGDKTDLANIRDYYMFKTLDIIKANNKKEAISYIKTLEEFNRELEILRPNDDVFDYKFYIGFFFALSQILSLYFEYGSLEGEAIKREYFDKSFIKTLEKYGLGNATLR